MYLDAIVQIPLVRGKITYRTKGDTTYVEFEKGRVYDRERKFTIVERKTIGKRDKSDPTKMRPNENFLKFFPDAILPDEKDRTERSCCIRIGSWIVMDKIIKEYRLPELLGAKLSGTEVGLLLDLAVYSIVEEDNRAQHYPAFAFNHPLFTEGMHIYSDSKVSSFLKEMDAEASVSFQNEWNETRNHRQRIYISYDSSNKKCQAGDLRIVEMGHSKTGEETPIFNYSVAFDSKNREPLFYELYPGSINDVSQLKCVIDKAEGYRYKKIGFVLDRGYFSKDNIDYLDEHEYSFIAMLKGKADLVQKWVLENKGSFETKRQYNIPAYETYGITIEKKLFATDRKPRYVHLYHSIEKEAAERRDVENKINQLTEFLNKNINQYKEFGPGMEQYFYLHYEDQEQKEKAKEAKEEAGSEEEKQGTKEKGKNEDKKGAKAEKELQALKKFVFFEEKASVIELELKLCGYFVIITSEKMTAREALEIYKGRDASEKLFMTDKTFLGNHCVRVESDESAASKVFIEFIALIIRNRIYNYLQDDKKKMAKKPNYMSVPAALRELDKIEMARQLDGVYRLDHAVTATQKAILNAFGLTESFVKEKAKEISLKLSTGQ